jgi:hypothetical protein
MTPFQTKIKNYNPDVFVPHDLHNFEQNFRETNCYSDLIIEIAHSLDLNPIACLGYTLAADFEGDQWTFGKPSHHDLQILYGIRIEELSLYKSLLEQLITQVERGSIPLLEADAFHLPDAIGIDYRTAHVKTTIGISHIDVQNKILHYFHNAIFTRLTGEDFDGIFSPQASTHKGYLPPYCEIAKLDQVFALPEAILKLKAFECAQFHFAKRPKNNPIQAHAEAVLVHQTTIIEEGESAYHAYTFVAPRQLGASHQLGAHFLRWLDPTNTHLMAAAEAYQQISNLSKSLVLKLARVAHSRKPADLSKLFDEMSTHWEHANQQLAIVFKT